METILIIKTVASACFRIHMSLVSAFSHTLMDKCEAERNQITLEGSVRILVQSVEESNDGECKQYTSRHFFSCTAHVLNNVLHNTLAQVSARARFTSSTWSSTLCGCLFFDSQVLTLFLSVCLSYLFFYLNPQLNLFLHVVVIGAIYRWHSAN